MIPQSRKVRIKLTCKKLENLKTINRANISTEKIVKPLWATNKTTRKMKRGINTEIVNWDLINKISFYCTNNNQFTGGFFQYKIWHRILSTNSLLFKCKLKQAQLRNFCNETKEPILHLFWECNFVKSLWFEMAEILKKTSVMENFYLSLTYILE